MKSELVFQVISEILKMYPEAKRTESGWILHESTSHTFFVGPAWSYHDNKEMVIAVKYYIPSLPCDLTKKNSKIIAKVNKRILNPRGFDLFARQESEEKDPIFWLSAALEFPISIEEFKTLEAEISVSGLTTYSGLGNLLEFSKIH
jgi:hypothetical protein